MVAVGFCAPARAGKLSTKLIILTWHLRGALPACPALTHTLLSSVPPPVCVQYYDIPALSLRSAIFPLLQAGVPGFKVHDMSACSCLRAGLCAVAACPHPLARRRGPCSLRLRLPVHVPAIQNACRAPTRALQADKVWNQGQVTMSGDRPIPVADPEERPQYFYYDR